MLDEAIKLISTIRENIVSSKQPGNNNVSKNSNTDDIEIMESAITKMGDDIKALQQRISTLETILNEKISKRRKRY